MLLMAIPVAGAATVGAQSQTYTGINAYTLPTWHSPYVVEPILSSGDTVPRTSNAAQMYQMVGIPDGIGVDVTTATTATVYLNHELTNTALSRPILGSDRVKGAFVSAIRIDRRHRAVLTADVAFSNVYQDTTLVGPTATEANATPAFSRFCSGSMAGAREGFDTAIYMTGEEANTGAFNVKGGQLVAIQGGNATALSDFGFFEKENALVMPRVDVGLYAGKTVVIVTEDGPAVSPYSGVFMYVGTKVPGAADPLTRNGLRGGSLYFLRSLNEDIASEPDFSYEGTYIPCEWVKAVNARNLDATQLKSFLVSNGFLGFSRPEDGTWSKTNRQEFYFVTTGGEGAVGDMTSKNKLGRGYRLTMNPTNPTGEASLELIFNADASRWADTPISPDNVDVNSRYLMVNEDGHALSRPVFNARNRDGSIWRFDLWDITAAPSRVAELTAIGRDNKYANPGTVTVNAPATGVQTLNASSYTVTQRGIWETSGIVSTDSAFGDGTFVFDVQAHSPTTAPGDNTVEDGQLLILLPNPAAAY